MTPNHDGTTLSVPLPMPTTTRPICTVTLDYTTEPRPDADRHTQRPERPSFSLPCMALTWQVLLSDGLEVQDVGSRLVHSEPSTTTSWPRRFLAPWPRLSSGADETASRTARAAILRELDELAEREEEDEIRLGDLFTRWDAGRWPIVVDRAALEDAGCGPRTRALPLRVESPLPGATALAWLRPLGLTVVPVGGVLLITTPAEVERGLWEGFDEEARDNAWAIVLRTAAGEGAGPSDRFQSVPRWLGESTPGPMPEGPNQDGRRPASGWTIQRFETLGWPDRHVAIQLIRRRTQTAWAWTIGLGVFALGIATRRLPAPTRLRGLSMLLFGAVLAASLASWVIADAAVGVVGGALATAAYWLGASLRPLRRSHDHTPSSAVGSTATPARRSGAEAALMLAALLSLVSLAVRGAQDVTSPMAEDRILAVFPDEPDTEQPKVILLLSDYERLRVWAHPRQTHPETTLGASDAIHQMTLGDEGTAVVESRLELWSKGESPTSWNFPIGAGRDLSATLDGEDVPVRVEPGGQMASVPVSGSGTHTLLIRRTVPLPDQEAGDVFDVPVNAIPWARVKLDAAALGGQVTVPSARGMIERRDGQAEGLLGPADRLEVRWYTEPAVAQPSLRGSAESVILWDAEPAGDRIRARITYRGMDDRTRVRIDLEPGLIVRSATVPGLIDIAWQGSTEQPEWVARIDPPLADGATVTLDLWRPLEPPPPDAPTMPARGLRRMPRIRPLGVERATGTLGFRHPEGWTGTLRPAVGIERVAEETFRKLWGSLPDKSASLAGAIRYVDPPQIDVRTGPETPRLSVRPDVAVEVQSGRLVVTAEAQVTEIQGRVDEVLVGIPAAFHLTRVVAAGLTCWSQPRANQLRLRFDKREQGPLTITIEGWLPIPTEPMAANIHSHESAIPWPVWDALELEPGSLTILAPEDSESRLTDSPGTTPIASPVGELVTPKNLRLESYRVERPGELGSLRWLDQPPRPQVAVWSLLTVYPESAEWSASIRYRAWGGPLDAITLSLPTEWARGASVEVVGTRSEVTTLEQEDETFWSIQFDRPVWGTQQVIIRSRQSFSRGQTLTFPALVPRGRGAVENYDLALADASGLSLSTEGSSALQPVDASRFVAEDLTIPRGTRLNVYHMRRTPWSLRVWASGEEEEAGDEGSAGDASPESTRVSLADLTCTIGLDGQVFGQARFEVEPRSGAFLPVLLPKGAEALGATVDGTPIRPLRGQSGQWLIPLGVGGASRVVLAWTSESSRDGEEGWHVLEMPGLSQKGVPTLLTFHAPESWKVEAESWALEAVPGDVLAVERVEWMGRQIVENLATIDRSSAQARASLLASLVQFELLARATERAANWESALDRSSGSNALHGRVLSRLEATRSSLEESLRLSGLDEFRESALARVGKATEDPLADLPDTSDLLSALRVRRLGQPRYFRKSRNATASGSVPSIRWSPLPPKASQAGLARWVVLAVVLAVVLLLARTLSLTPRPLRIAVAVVAALASLGAGPWASGATLLAMGLGVWKGR